MFIACFCLCCAVSSPCDGLISHSDESFHVCVCVCVCVRACVGGLGWGGGCARARVCLCIFFCLILCDPEKKSETA